MPLVLSRYSYPLNPARLHQHIVLPVAYPTSEVSASYIDESALDENRVQIEYIYWLSLQIPFYTNPAD